MTIVIVGGLVVVALVAFAIWVIEVYAEGIDYYRHWQAEAADSSLEDARATEGTGSSGR